jgi:hypothetical protein
VECDPQNNYKNADCNPQKSNKNAERDPQRRAGGRELKHEG